MAAEQFNEMLEASLQQSNLPEAGEVIKTKVIHVTDKDVVLDIGVKSEARIPITEFSIPPKVGEEIEVFVERSEGNYSFRVSFKKAEERKAGLKVKNALETQEEIMAKVIDIVKGGVKVLLENSVQGFLPLSQLDLHRVESPESYKGKTFGVKVVQYDRKGRNLNVVVSRRAILEVEKKEKQKELYATLTEGQVVECKVLKLNPKSVLVQVEGAVIGIIRVGDLSWDRVNHPKDMLKEGQKISAKIIQINPDKKDMLLSLKDMQEDPFKLFIAQHSEEEIIEGEVFKFGNNRVVVVKFGEGIEGIIRFEDLTWSRSFKKPEEVVSLGSTIKVKILEIDKEKGRLLLGLKQVQNDPWSNIDEKYPIGKKVKGIIKSKKEFGVFVEIEEGIEALLHKNDIDWSLKNIDLDQYKEGDEIEGIVISLNRKDRKIGMGMKQLFDNPWKNFASENPRGSIVEGKIKEIKENELVLDFGNEIEGFLSKRELEERVENLNEKFKLEDSIKALVLDISPDKNILKLSVKEMLKREREKEVSQYMSKSTESSHTLGDLLGSKLDRFKTQSTEEKPKTDNNKQEG